MIPDSYSTHRKVSLTESPIGRDIERDEAINLLRDKRILLLYGPPGQGKTVLAKYIAVTLNEIHNYEDGIHEIDLQNERQLSNVIKQIGTVLGDQDTGNPIGLLGSKKALIILDSFEYIWRNTQQEPLKRFFHSLIDSLSGDSTIIITCQDYFYIDGLVPKSVRVLNPEDAVKLFHSESQGIYKGEREDKVLNFVSSQLGGHAFSIKIVARYSYHVAKVEFDVLARLWQEKFADIADYKHSIDDKKLQTSFELSYSTLSDEDKHFFLALSLLPDGISGNQISEIWKGDDTIALKAFANLANRSLIESEDFLRKMLGPIFLFAQDKRREVEHNYNHILHSRLMQSAELIDKFYTVFVLDHAPQVSDKDPSNKNRFIHEHFHNIHSFLDRRIEPSTNQLNLSAAECVLRLYWAYHNNLSGYKNVISSAEDAVHYFEKAANVFEINKETEKVMKCRYFIGNILWLRGQVDKALPYFNEVINSEHSSKPIKLETKRAYAHLEYRLRSIAKSVDLYNECLQDSNEVGDKEYRSRCWAGLLDAYRKLENFDEAERCFNSALIESANVNPSVLGNIIRGYAYVLLVKNDLDEAAKKYSEALKIFEKISLFGEAHCRRGIGDVYVRLKQFEVAQIEFDKADKLYEDARKNPCLGMGLVILGRGRLSAAKNELSSALSYFKSAAELFSFQNLNEPFEQAQANELIGETLRRSIEIEGALGYYQLALNQYERTECKIAIERVKQQIARLKTALP